MAKGGKFGYKRKTKKIRLEKKGSDESDEDYRLDEDENIDLAEDEYCSSLAEESEESLGDIEAEEEDEDDWVKIEKKVIRPRGRKCLQTRKRNGVVKPRKKKVDYSEEEEDSDENNFSGAIQKKTNKVSKQEDKGEEIDLSGDDYCPLAEDESEESLGDFEAEEQDDDNWITIEKKVVRPRGRECLQTRKRNRIVNPRKKKVVYSEEEFSDEYKVSKQEDKNDYNEAAYRAEADEFADEKPRNKSQVSRTEKYGDSSNENPREKISYQEEEEEDDDYDKSDDEDDEEFTPGGVLKRTRRIPVPQRVLRRKTRSNLLKESRDENPTSRKKKTINGGGPRRRGKSYVNSDSDFVTSGSSDYDYTISEEERAQVREATECCTRLTITSFRSSSPLKVVKEEDVPFLKRKHPGRKGKQKVADLKIEVGKQVCGICLSEEGKRTVRGVLNCCSHYFCFACIMEWSKVESRCPLCKQRFATICRTTRADDGHDLRDAVFPIPERDQVYQPSEEELRGYLDPYENVICTECQQGGDDALMLLCDLCDSPAHTYCVGLGREVPDGNWYCDGCRPTAIASSNAQPMNPIPDIGGSNNFYTGSSPIASARETFDLNELYVPDTPLSGHSGHSQSPRHSIGHFRATSPAASGAGAFTLFARRRIQRQIHQFLNNRNRESGRGDPSMGISLFGAVIGRDEAIANTVMPARTVPQNIYFQGTSTDHSNGNVGLNLVGGLGHQQLLHPCSGTSNTGVDASTSRYQFREATLPSRALQGSLHTRF